MQVKRQYIAFLRGVNVGGHRVNMEKLRSLFTQLGFANVRSYIQTGNVFFETHLQDANELRIKIEQHLQNSLGFEVAVALRTVEELEQILQMNPFDGIVVTPDIRLSITFLTNKLQKQLPVPYTTLDGGYELIATTATELFVVWHLIKGRPGNSYGVLEKASGVQGTTRFWHTAHKILTAAKQ